MRVSKTPEQILYIVPIKQSRNYVSFELSIFDTLHEVFGFGRFWRENQSLTRFICCQSQHHKTGLENSVDKLIGQHHSTGLRIGNWPIQRSIWTIFYQYHGIISYRQPFKYWANSLGPIISQSATVHFNDNFEIILVNICRRNDCLPFKYKVVNF